MKRTFLCILLLAFPVLLNAQSPSHQQGTIVRMRLTDCMGPQHGFMATMSGGAQVEPSAHCPEYVLVTDKVVYVIVGKTADQILPLAESTRFHFQKNEVLIRVDDANKESRFHIKAMALRAEWERNQQLAEAVASDSHHLEGARVVDTAQ